MTYAMDTFLYRFILLSYDDLGLLLLLYYYYYTLYTDYTLIL